MSSMLDLVSETSYLTEATTAEATELVTQMAEVEQLRRLQIHQHERYGVLTGMTIFISNQLFWLWMVTVPPYLPAV